MVIFAERLGIFARYKMLALPQAELFVEQMH